jgi:ubiquinone/menaquinone biosynthesis C-methylase UbiE
MAELFDTYDANYREVVQSSIDFSGLPHSFFMAAKARHLQEAVGTHFGRDVKPSMLDIGCGVGTLHPFVQKVFGRVSGVDVSEACIAQARTSNPSVQYKSYDGHTLPYGDREFDAVTAVCVMHHVAPVEWLRFVQEARRVVRPGGLVCIMEHNPYNPLTRLAVSRCPFDSDAILLRAGQTRRLLRQAGLHNVQSKHFLLLPSATAFAHRIERFFSNLPLAAQYLTSGEKGPD